MMYWIYFLCTFFLAIDPWKGDEYAKNSTSQKESAQDFLVDIPLNGNEHLLDVGCGDGKISASLAHQLRMGKVIGVDISPSMIETAKKSFSEISNLEFLLMDATKIPFHNAFDLITSFTVMQWVLNQEGALKCFHTALKPGGKVFIQFPMGLPSEMEKALKKVLKDPKWKKHFQGFSPPWRFYSMNEYLNLLEKANLDPISLKKVPKKEIFPSRKVFHQFISQWFPYLRPLSENLKEVFLEEVIDEYLSFLPPLENGQVLFPLHRLEVEAMKPK